MKLITLFLFAAILQISAATYSQTTLLKVSGQNLSIGQVIESIEKQSEFSFFYNVNQIDLLKKVNIEADNQVVNKILDDILSGTGMTYTINNKLIIIHKQDEAALLEVAQQQGRKIAGKVTDRTGAAIPGAAIIVKGTTIGVTTDIDGKFFLSLPTEAKALVFTFVVMKTQEMEVGNKSTINVVLEEETIGLEEVVAVGYGTQKKANLTGAVGSVQMVDMESRPLTNASLALQGTVAGVYALQSSGKPGDDNAVINIRGVGTLNNSDPLILIDGFPGNMSDVNANDIKSISVLKDASSAAIYGNRAANGVILITTKRGLTGKMTVTYDGYIGVQNATALPKGFNSVQYATLYNEATANTGMQPRYTASEIQKFADGNDPLYPNINYFDVYYDPASITNHRLNIAGGSETLKYAFMLGYLDQKGILVGTSYKKVDFRSNFDAYFLKDKKLRLSANISGNKGDTGAPTDEWSAKFYATNAPVYPLKDQNGNWVSLQGERNYYGEIKEGSTQKIMRYTVNSQLDAEYKITNGLSAQVTYGFNVVASNSNAFHANVLLANLNGTSKTLTSDLTDRDDLNTQSLLTSLLKYQKKFGKHNINLLAGYSEEEFIWKWNSGYRSQFINNTQRILNLGAPSTMQNDAGAYDLGLQSAFGRINYIFDEKYLFEANIRKDGSSRFGSGYKWGTFPSFSLGWIMSNENFIKNIAWIDMLKVRGSWGKLGNQNIGTYYAASEILSTGNNYSLGGSLNSGVANTSMSNKQTSWETSAQTNFGLDLGINKTIGITVDYFNKKTSDILMQAPIPITMGNLNPPYVNVGEVVNKGIECSVSYKKTFSNGLKFNSTLNLTHIENEITNLNGKSPIINGPKALVEGYAINSFYGYKSDGIYQISDFTWQNNSDKNIPHLERIYVLKEGVTSVANYTATPGDHKYKDLNGDGKVTMDKDRTVIGKQFPDLSYSLQMNVDWKQFDFSFFFQGVQGIEGYIYYEIACPFSGASNNGIWWLDRWTPENPTNKLPKLMLDGVRNQVYSDFYMEDASYLRLKNIELGYTLKTKISSAIGINSLRVYGNIQNAFTITNFRGFDPEQTVNETRAQAYPQVRIFSAGVNINF